MYRASGRLWRRALNEFTSRPLPDSTGAVYPFWSPDSRQIAFVRDRKLWSCPIDAANATLVGDAPEGLSGPAPVSGRSAVIWCLRAVTTVGLFSAPGGGGDCARDPAARQEHRDRLSPGRRALGADGGLLVAVHRSTGSDTIAAFVNGGRRTVLQLSGESIHRPVLFA